MEYYYIYYIYNNMNAGIISAQKEWLTDGSYYYAVTIKEARANDTQVSDIDSQIAKLYTRLKAKRPIQVGPITYENDSRSKLHAHFTVRCRSFRFTSVQEPGWSIYIKRLKTYKDLAKWDNYLKKEALNRPLLQQREARNYYSLNNGFTANIEKE